MKKNRTIKVVIIIGVVIAVAVAVHYLGGELIEIINAHMGL